MRKYLRGVYMFERTDENYIYEVVSKNIKKQRKLKGLTQEQLASKMNYSTQFISNIESKTHQTFSLGTLWRIALVLDININLLFDESIIKEERSK
jgi:transcriptional regulator with XRE-family HTH domain